MKNSSFSCLRSINNQLHNKLSQQNQYESYLKRIDDIVDRKPLRDTSPQFYMSFLNKCRRVARTHKEAEQEIKLVQQNKVLLQKIMDVRNKKLQISSQSYHLNMHQKRNRQIQRINDQNMKIAKRITEQYSQIRRSLYPKENKSPKDKKPGYACWNYSPLKERKLPKLVQSPTKQSNEAKQKSFDESQSVSHVFTIRGERQKYPAKVPQEKQKQEKNNNLETNQSNEKKQNKKINSTCY